MAQFVSSTPIDATALSSLALDPNLTQFLQIAFGIVTRERFPSPAQGVIPPLYTRILHFFPVLALNHTDLLTALASVAPLDILPLVFFAQNITNDRIPNLHSSHLFTSPRFLFAISSSQSILISSATNRNIIFVAIFSLLAVQPAAAAFLESFPTFAWLHSKLISLLLSSDHNFVIAAKSSLSGLFNVGSDSETLLRLAVRGLTEPPSLPLPLPLATALDVDHR
jgi:hypothetical protein